MSATALTHAGDHKADAGDRMDSKQRSKIIKIVANVKHTTIRDQMQFSHGCTVYPTTVQYTIAKYTIKYQG